MELKTIKTLLDLFQILIYSFLIGLDCFLIGINVGKCKKQNKLDIITLFLWIMALIWHSIVMIL